MLLVIALLIAVFLVSPAVGVGVVALAAVAEMGEAIFWRRFLRRYRVQTGAEAMVGKRGEVVEPCDPLGRVRVRGELWQARSAQPLPVGQPVRVVAVVALTLEVEATD